MKTETALERRLRKEQSPGPGAYTIMEPSRTSIGFSIRTKGEDARRNMTKRMLKSLDVQRQRPGPTDYDILQSSFDSSSTVSMRIGKGKTYRLKDEIDPLTKASFSGPGPTTYIASSSPITSAR